MISNKELLEESSNINLPGWKNITDKKQSVYLRAIWSLAVFFSIAVCVIQIIERVNHFSQSTVNVALRLDFKAPKKFPNFVICPKKFFEAEPHKMMLERRLGRKLTEPVDVCDYMQLNETSNLADLWDIAKVPDHKLRFALRNSFKMVREDLFEVISFKTISGTCALLKYNTSFEITPNTVLEIVLFTSETNHYLISFHHNPIVNHHSLLEGELLDGAVMYLNSLTVQRYHALNTTESPCVSSGEFHSCRRQCLNELLNKNVQCRLPFMDDPAKPFCKSVSQCKNAMKITNEIMTGFNWAKCQCLKECHSTSYKTTVESLLCDANLYLSNFKAFPEHTVEEFQSYTIVGLICDIGGILSLCLGFCLLTALEVLDVFVFANKATNTSKINKIQVKELTKKPIKFAPHVWTTTTTYNE